MNDITANDLKTADKMLNDAGVPKDEPGRRLISAIQSFPEGMVRASIRAYPFASRIFADGQWLTAEKTTSGWAENKMPYGSVRLGVVLKNRMEVSVIQKRTDLEKWEFHRPMAILKPGDLLGAFEFSDFLSGKPPVQKYTVYSGIRTFFFGHKEFCDARIFASNKEEGRDSRKVLFEAIKKIVPSVNHTFISCEQFATWNRNFENFCDCKSVTQYPLETLKELVGEDAHDWDSEVLMVEIGSDFLPSIWQASEGDVSVQRKTWGSIREIIQIQSWKQSSHLRESAIRGYVDDEIYESVLEGEKTAQVLAGAFARELGVVKLLLSGERPGFRKLKGAEIGYAGPFPALESKIGDCLGTDTEIYLPSYFNEDSSPLIWPVWPYIDSIHGRNKFTQQAKARKVEDVVKSFKQEKWDAVKNLLGKDYPYQEFNFNPMENKEKWSANVLLERASIELPAKISGIPALDAVSYNPSDSNAPCALVAVQHLLEETVAMFDKLLELEIVKASDILIIGKPYSASRDVMAKLRARKIEVKVPSGTWTAGNFDRWFDEEVATELGKFTKRYSEMTSPILLLDDGGTLIKAASGFGRKGGYRGVEQTSRGNQAAFDAKFPVVLVSSSALKLHVEPEFVCRAAVEKLSRYFPEALEEETVAIVGMGTLGTRFARYLIGRNQKKGDIAVKKIVGVDCDGVVSDPSEISTRSIKLIKPKEAENALEICKIIFGCRGNDISGFLGKDLKGKLLISLSSSDVEFMQLLKENPHVNIQSESILENIERRGGKIAFGGFPVTFDRTQASGALIEWQLTRALLLQEIVQVLGKKNNVAGAQPLLSVGQIGILQKWAASIGYKAYGENEGSIGAGIENWRKDRESEVPNEADIEWLQTNKSMDVELKNKEAFANAKKKAGFIKDA